jgi:hypothetical protein
MSAIDLSILALGALMYAMGLAMALSVWVIMRREIAVFRRIVTLAKRSLDRGNDPDLPGDPDLPDDPGPPGDSGLTVRSLWPDYVPPGRLGTGPDLDRWPGRR